MRNGEDYIKEVCLMNECVQRDIIASFEHNEWKIYLPQEKNSESFHFQTILRECLKDVATWLRDYLFMSMTTLRNLIRKIYLEALVIPKKSQPIKGKNRYGVTLCERFQCEYLNC